MPRKPSVLTSKIDDRHELHVGDIVRRLRKTRHLSVRGLAGACGFSPSFISQVELHQASPSIASTERIAAALGVTLGELFNTGSGPSTPVLRVRARPIIQSEWSRASVESLGPRRKDGHFEPMVITIQPGGATGHKPYTRRAEQLAVILKGMVELTLDEQVYDLKRGDTADIPADSPHCWRNRSRRPSQILIVTAREGR